MKDIWWIILGSMCIVALLVAISVVYPRTKTIKSSPLKSEKKGISLNRDFSREGAYVEITVNDIVEGRVLEAEMAEAKPFPQDTLPLTFKEQRDKKSLRMSVDDAEFDIVKANLLKAPYRNLYYYKINFGDKWGRILGQQVKNKDGSYSFLHYLLGYEDKLWLWGGDRMAIQPLISAEGDYLDYIIPREFISDDGHYYEPGSEMESLIKKWHKTGNVPHELENKILLMNVKW